jgi:dihydroxy-acid dehydratase
LNVELSVKDITARLKKVKTPVPRYLSGVMAKYARHVSSASEGAVTS